MSMASSAKKRSKGSKASNGKRKRRHSGTDDDEPAFLSSKYAEPPTSKIYNRNFSRKDPAELFRKDLISAMKMADSEPLTYDDYWVIDDSWKPEWEKGVQVPIYPDALPEPQVKILRKKSKESTFRLPKKLIRFTRDNFFNPEVHVMSYTGTLSERTCRYDMDDVDLDWLTLVNEDREDFGLQPLEENVVEQIIEEFETQCYANFQEAIKSEEGLGVEYDEDAICDVCRSTVYQGKIGVSSKPDSQEGNEMVFCDSCNICVHQICYGITKIPEGSWVCRTCALGIRPACVLCPNRGGAMKTTRCGQNWAHVGCAVWIPEVSFLNFVKMEPITRVSHIPPTRWALLCSICKKKVGACIQCSEKNCKVAFHVTCAFQEGLQMRASVKLTDAEDDKLQAFCQKHSRKLRGCFSDSEEDVPSVKNKKKETLTSEERANIRQQKIQAKEAEFYNYVNIDDVSNMFEYDRTDIEIIYNYWKLKRKANWNRALLPPKIDTDNNCTEENTSFAFLKKVVHCRKDLEIARNLCYMAIKREKLSQRWIQYKEHILLKQVEILSDKASDLTEEERNAVLNANHGDMAYDKKHTGMNGPSPNVVDVLTSLAGEDYVKTHLNGAMKGGQKSDHKKSKRTPNPYAKHYLNGLVKRSQRWLVDKQKKVSSLQNSLDVKTNTNISFQSSSDHLHSDDGCDSSKDLHDLNLDSKYMSQTDPKFECFNPNDNAFVNLETYHSNDALVKENSSEESDKKIEICFPELNTFSHSSNDSTFASPPKHLYESLDESMSESEVRITVKSTDVAHYNHESKSGSGLETEKQDSDFANKELVSSKQKNKVLSSKHRKRAKRNIDCKINNSIVNSSEDTSNLSNSEPVIESSSDELENLKLSLELPIENYIDIHNEGKLTTVEIVSTEVVPEVKPKLEKNITFHNDDKLNSSVQCVIVKSEIPLLPAKSENVSGKIKCTKVNENCDRPIKIEAPELIQNEESKSFNDKSFPNSIVSAKDTKIRPSSNKDSPLRTQSPTFKTTENGLIKGCKSNSKQNAEKSQILSKLLQSKSKNLSNSHPVSSVNKQHPSSSIIKCQEKNSSAASKSDESESAEVKDSCIEAPPSAPVPRKDMLRGYKIPKKPRTEKPEENSLDLKRGNTPLSPLPDITSSSLSGYHTKAKHSWRKLEPRTKGMSCKPRTNMNGNIQRQSPERLVLKLKKDTTSDPESPRWKTDPNNFNRNMGGWIGEFPLHQRDRLLPPPPPPPAFLSHHPPRQWPRMQRRGFRPIHMAYGNGPYT